MYLELTFKQVCAFIKDDEPKLIDAVDKLLSLTLIGSPILLGPAALPLLSLLSVKNELVKLGKGVFDSFSKKKDADFIARQTRMQMAYGLICYTAFFEALDKQLPQELRKKIRLLKEDKILLAKDAHAQAKAALCDTTGKSQEIIDADRFSTIPIAFPHPTETLGQQQAFLSKIYHEMATGFKVFIQELALWEELSEEKKASVSKTIEGIPQLAVVCFEAQYFELSRRYEDFAVWANLHEHKETKELIGSLSEYVRQYAAFAKADKAALDVGFAKLRQAVLNMPQMLNMAQATEIVEGLTLHYKARINEPIIEDKEEAQEEKPRLSFPRIRDAFIPQSFRVLRQTVKARRLEDEETWKEPSRRDDLGAFLLNYLSSPYSTETPLLILGHPGSGKSLLTTILSAQLMSEQYTVIRVPLREVDSEAGVVAQIEEQIGRITHVRLDSWAKISGAFKNNPPVIILDGYDELLQASGKVFSGYLKDVQNFQKNEAEQGRPVRVIVTSRITLIDKATVPAGSTIVRLLEFDRRQREKWISIWNKTNANYFKEASVQAFELPGEDDKDAAKILSLAEQPLLLLMLALYDSEDNKLRNSKSLDRTVLYESLLNRFVMRERDKEKKFDDLNRNDKKKEIDRDMQRLGVAAIGMYNRRKLHILSPELDEDLKFFSLEREIVVESGRPLSQADLLLGSFFFVHKSKSQQKAGVAELHEETSAFEFLHNTFGEFLTADFIIRQAMAEVVALKALKEQEVLRAQLEQKLSNADGFSRAWFASLVYTPLFTRPVVLEMIREWIGHMLQRRQLSRQEFLSHLDTIILNQIKRLLNKREMPSIVRKEAAQEGYRAPFGDHPLLGHIAIYSVNLILLRAVVSSDPFIFDESQIGSHEDGARPWDQLTHIWRSWFSIDNLNGITAILRADREQSRISVRSKDAFRISESRNRLETFLNVSLALGDNISSGLAGLILYDPTEDAPLELYDIDIRLAAEQINLRLSIMMKQLYRSIFMIHRESVEGFLALATDALHTALDASRYQELDQIVTITRRVLTRVFKERGGFETIERIKDFDEFYHRFFHPRIWEELLRRAPETAVNYIQMMRELPPYWNFGRFEMEFFEQLFHPRYFEDLLHRNPEAAAIHIQLMREMGAEHWMARYGEKLFERLFRTHYFEELIYRNPEAALSLLKIAREIGAEPLDQRTWKRAYKLSFDPDYFMELLHRNPEAAVSFIQIMREMGAEHWIARYGEELFERFLHPRNFEELIYRNPEAALSLLKIAREIGAEALVQRLWRFLIDQLLNPLFLRRLLFNKPKMFVELLRLARTQVSRSAAETIRESLAAFGKDSGGYRALIEQLPLEALPELQWLAETTMDKQLSSTLELLLSGERTT